MSRKFFQDCLSSDEEDSINDKQQSLNSNSFKKGNETINQQKNNYLFNKPLIDASKLTDIVKKGSSLRAKFQQQWENVDQESSESEGNNLLDVKGNDKNNNQVNELIGAMNDSKSDESIPKQTFKSTIDEDNHVNDSEDEEFEYKPRLKGQLTQKNEENFLSEDKTFYLNKFAARHLIVHQLIGLKWLWKKYITKQGAILGDDMGMGKTIQIIALLLVIYNKTGQQELDRKQMQEKKRHGMATSTIEDIRQFRKRNGKTSSTDESMGYGSLQNQIRQLPTCIFCPKSLVENWKEEIQRWGYFVMDAMNQSDEHNQNLLDQAMQGKLECIIISYPKVEKYIDRLEKIQWGVLVFDEGHILKNEKSRIYQAVMRIRHAECRIMLTGTPIQNNLKELWCLLYLISNQKFSDKSEFISHFERPISMSMSSKASEEAIRLGERRNKELQHILSKLILSRKKEELAGIHALQGKEDVVVLCELSSLQMELYQCILTLPDFDNIRYYDQPCSCGSQTKRSQCCDYFRYPYKEVSPSTTTTTTSSSAKSQDRDRNGQISSRQAHLYSNYKQYEIDRRAVIWRQNHVSDEPCPSCPLCIILPCLNKLAHVASHPALLQCDGTDGQLYHPKQSRIRQFVREALPATLLHQLGGDVRSNLFTDLSKTEVSGKLNTLRLLLDVFVHRQDKSLVFSLSTQVLDIIEMIVKANGWRYCRLDGQTDIKERQQLVKEFNKNPNICVFLLSSKAGGLGLNLTSASKVIIFDVNWNPTIDMQSQDRAYRIGQTSCVTVYRLVAKGTIEELMYMRQLYKQQLQQSVLITSTAPRTKGGRSMIRNFEGVEGEATMRGELFGTFNLFQFSEKSILQELRKKYGHGRSTTSRSKAALPSDPVTGEEGLGFDCVGEAEIQEVIQQDVERVRKEEEAKEGEAVGAAGERVVMEGKEAKEGAEMNPFELLKSIGINEGNAHINDDMLRRFPSQTSSSSASAASSQAIPLNPSIMNDHPIQTGPDVKETSQPANTASLSMDKGVANEKKKRKLPDAFQPKSSVKGNLSGAVSRVVLQGAKGIDRETTKLLKKPNYGEVNPLSCLLDSDKSSELHPIRGETLNGSDRSHENRSEGMEVLNGSDRGQAHRSGAVEAINGSRSSKSDSRGQSAIVSLNEQEDKIQCWVTSKQQIIIDVDDE